MVENTDQLASEKPADPDIQVVFETGYICV